jgi:hypothetical protein
MAFRQTLHCHAAMPHGQGEWCMGCGGGGVGRRLYYHSGIFTKKKHHGAHNDKGGFVPVGHAFYILRATNAFMLGCT